jgi:allantoinase
MDEISLAANFAWPAGIRLPVVLTFEHQSGEGAAPMPGNRPNYRAGDIMEYGARRGIWNILEALDRRSIKATFAVSALTAINFPDSVNAIARAGHEIAGMGYRFESARTLSPDAEREMVRRSAGVLEQTIGTKTRGWRCPDYRVSPQTLEILADENFLWDSSLLNDDLPYALGSAERQIVEIPFTTSTADKTFVGDPAPQRGGPTGLANAWESEFAYLYDESADAPRCLLLSLQTWASGRVVILEVLEKFIDKISAFDGVVFGRCGDLAEWCFGERREYLQERHHSSSTHVAGKTS